MSNIVTVSAKYQVVIPKEIREHLQLTPGQKVTVTKTSSGEVSISAKSAVEEVYGKYKGMWGEDSTAWLERERAKANRVRY